MLTKISILSEVAMKNKTCIWFRTTCSIEVAIFRIEKIRFHVIYVVHTVTKKRNRSSYENQIWTISTCSMNVPIETLNYTNPSCMWGYNLLSVNINFHCFHRSLNNSPVYFLLIFISRLFLLFGKMLHDILSQFQNNSWIDTDVQCISLLCISQHVGKLSSLCIKS